MLCKTDNAKRQSNDTVSLTVYSATITFRHIQTQPIVLCNVVQHKTNRTTLWLRRWASWLKLYQSGSNVLHRFVLHSEAFSFTLSLSLVSAIYGICMTLDLCPVLVKKVRLHAITVKQSGRPHPARTPMAGEPESAELTPAGTSRSGGFSKVFPPTAGFPPSSIKPSARTGGTFCASAPQTVIYTSRREVHGLFRHRSVMKWSSTGPPANRAEWLGKLLLQVPAERS